MSEATQEILRIRPWHTAMTCDEPQCEDETEYAITFRYARPIDTLYLCCEHMRETARNYGHD